MTQYKLIGSSSAQQACAELLGRANECTPEDEHNLTMIALHCAVVTQQYPAVTDARKLVSAAIRAVLSHYSDRLTHAELISALAFHANNLAGELVQMEEESYS